MWLVFAILSLLLYTVSDLLNKIIIDKGDKYTPLKMVVIIGFASFLFSIVFYVFGLGESGLSPLQILINNPLIMLDFTCIILCAGLYPFSLKFVGLSIESIFSGYSGLFYFIGIIIINVLSGKLDAVNELYQPLRFIPIIVVIIFSYLLTNYEVIVNRKNSILLEKAKKKRHFIVIGIIILLFALLLDTSDSIITTLYFDEDSIGVIDFLMASYFFAIIPATIVLFYLIKKKSVSFILVKKGNINLIIYSLFTIFSMILFLIASSLNAVKTGILFIAYPVFPVIGDKIILKEKYSLMQNICIWIIILASVVFCIADYV